MRDKQTTSQLSNSLTCQCLILPSQCPDDSVNTIVIQVMFMFSIKLASSLICPLFLKTPVARLIGPLYKSCWICNNWEYVYQTNLRPRYACASLPQNPALTAPVYPCNTDVGTFVSSFRVYLQWGSMWMLQPRSGKSTWFLRTSRGLHPSEALFVWLSQGSISWNLPGSMSTFSTFSSLFEATSTQ